MASSKLYKFGKKKKNYRKKTKYTKKSKTVKTVKAIVRKEINKNLESKTAWSTTPVLPNPNPVNPPQYFCPINSLMNFDFTTITAPVYNSSTYNVSFPLPAIQPGVKPGDRVGTQITPQKMVIRGILRTTKMGSAQQTYLANVAFRVMVVSLKGVNSYEDIIADNGILLNKHLQNLLKTGNTTIGFGGNLEDLFCPVNTDLFTVHYNKVIRTDQSNMVTMAGSQDLRTCKFWRYTHYFGKSHTKVLKYSESENNDLYPNNFFPIVLVGYVFLNGSSPSIALLGEFQYNTTLTYQDG